MTTPLYVVAGFLESGKTTFIAQMLRHCRKKEILVLQFEEGEQELNETKNCKLLSWSKKETGGFYLADCGRYLHGYAATDPCQSLGDGNSQ